MSALFLFARIAGTAVAIPTEEIEAVVKLTELSPIPAVPRHIAGLATLRSRVLTVIDAAALITGEDGARPPLAADQHAVVCDVGGHSYAIMADAIDDISTVEAGSVSVCGRLSDMWRPHVASVLDDGGEQRFVLSVPALISHCGGAPAPG